MKTHLVRPVAVAVALLIAATAQAKKGPPAGLLAASVGDAVVMLEPEGGRTFAIETGPVGWLYPAPAGILFAPDVINGRTTVIDIRLPAVVERIDGLTMPLFGMNPDRYMALTGDILQLSYPDRALIAKIPAEITDPWQAVVAPDGAAMIVLERRPDGRGGGRISAFNLQSRQLVYRRTVGRDIVHIALSSKLGLLAAADPDGRTVHLAEPGTLMPIAARSTAGRPLDVVFTGGGEVLASALDDGAGAGALELAFFRASKDKGLSVRRTEIIPLGATPVRADASPDDRHVAVALVDGTVVIVDVERAEVVGTHRLPGAARDLRWCDPDREGPLAAAWSDGQPETPDFGPFIPKASDDVSSGLEEPVWKDPPR
ncbi:MAG: hypothetical protein MUC56_16470 [Thermoanaerobaculales bacterium]|jgi:hypothetical protein|nr:hypothetical protein [Thermoanaerobaculales bacterium]